MGVPQAAAALRRDERAYPRQTPDVPSRQRAQAILVPSRAYALAASCGMRGMRGPQCSLVQLSWHRRARTPG